MCLASKAEPRGAYADGIARGLVPRLNMIQQPGIRIYDDAADRVTGPVIDDLTRLVFRQQRRGDGRHRNIAVLGGCIHGQGLLTKSSRDRLLGCCQLRGILDSGLAGSQRDKGDTGKKVSGQVMDHRLLSDCVCALTLAGIP